MSIDRKAAQFWEGFSLPLAALDLIFKVKGLKRYLLLPVLVNALLYAVILGVGFYFAWEYLLEWELSVPQWDFWGGFGAWLSDAVNFLAGALKIFLFAAACFLLFFFAYYTFVVVGMIVTSPLNDMLSEKTELALSGKKNVASLPLKLTIKAAALSTYDAIGIVLRQAVWSLAALPFLFVPAVGMAPLFLVTAYFTGLGFVDCAMARNYLRNRHKKPAFKDQYWSILGLGVATELLFLIPFAGLFILPAGVVAGTMLYCGYDWDRAFRENGLTPPDGFVPPDESTDQPV